ncbi:MAG: 6-bladed beta-propeller [Candidatus Cloacimonetes bacterium]|nr:6-bladed beta-propeller [Candidatus Cloacimonadota bacterium]
MKKLIQIILVVICFLVSCGEEKKKSSVIIPFNDIAKFTDSTYCGKVYSMAGKENKIYFSDFSNHRFICLNLEGDLIYSLDTKGRGPGEFNYPGYFEIKHDSIYLFDMGNHRINIYTISGNYKREFPVKNYSGSSRFAIDDDDRFYFSSANSKEPVVVTDRHGNKLFSFGQPIKRYRDTQFQLNHNSERHLMYDEINARIIAVSKTTPIVEIYSLQGKLLKENDLSKDVLLKEYDDFVSSDYKNLPNNASKLYFASVRIENNEIQLLLNDLSKDDGRGAVNRLLSLSLDKQPNLIERFVLDPAETDEMIWVTDLVMLEDKIIASDGLNQKILFYKVTNKK